MRIVFLNPKSDAAWCGDCSLWLAPAEKCEHYTVSTQTPAEFAAERGIAPPRGVHCLRHFSWLCSEGRGECQMHPTDCACGGLGFDDTCAGAA